MRELRGVVRWVVRPWRARDYSNIGHRAALGSTYDLPRHPDRPTGSCAWCWTALERRKYSRANYHPDCVVIMCAMKAQRATPYGKYLIPVAPCPCGAEGTQLDHIVPLSIAAHRGLRQWVRAFLPGNLQWLCRECHRTKTAGDLTALADLRRPQGPVMPKPVRDSRSRRQIEMDAGQRSLL